MLQIKRVNNYIIVIELFFILAISITVVKMNSELKLLAKNETIFTNLESIAKELRQSSDTLTCFSRGYVSTGDKKFKDRYYQVLDTRNGKALRPHEYSDLHWDLEHKLDHKKFYLEEKESLQDKISKSQFNEYEKKKLATSENNSNALAQLEFEAFNAVEYYLSIDMAKELSMIENNQIGRKIRKYFIEIEKRYFTKSEQQDNEKIDLDYLLEVSEKLIKLANIFGFSGNQAFLSADKGVRKITGNSPLEILNEKHLVSNSKDQILTPTQIGKIVEKSAMEVNILLQDLGFQEKIEKVWYVTENGKEFAEMLDTNKKHSDGTPVKQIKWKSEFLEKLQKL